MKKTIYAILTLSLILTACAQETPPPEPTQDVDAIYTQAAATLYAEASLQENQEAATPEPTQVPVASTETQELVNADDGVYSWTYPAEQDIAGLTIQVGRVLIGNKESLETKFSDLDFDQAVIFQDKTVIVEVIYKITNNTDQTITVYPDQGTAIVGSEQINFSDYMLSGATVGEDVGGDIYPGVTLIGGLWFGLKRTPIEEISGMTLIVGSPVISETWESLGPDYQIQLDLTERKYDDIPEELR